jgi:hypothetical protein
MQRFLVACVAAFLVGTTPGCSGPKSAPEKETVERQVSGTFRSIHAETGQQSFGITFVSPPKVSLHTTPEGKSGTISNEQRKAHDHTLIVETTTTGFKWKNTGQADDCNAELYWVATGLVNK